MSRSSGATSTRATRTPRTWSLKPLGRRGFLRSPAEPCAWSASPTSRRRSTRSPSAYTKDTGTEFDASYSPPDQVQTSLRTQLGAGNAPDIHVVYPGNGSAMSMAQIARAGLLTGLGGQEWAGRIPGNFSEAFQLDGKTYLYSAGISVIGAIYNKRGFADAGVEPPGTWSGFLDVCERLKRAGTTPIALGAQTQWVTQLITCALVPSTVYAVTPDFDQRMRDGRATFAGSGWADAFDMYL